MVYRTRKTRKTTMALYRISSLPYHSPEWDKWLDSQPSGNYVYLPDESGVGGEEAFYEEQFTLDEICKGLNDSFYEIQDVVTDRKQEHARLIQTGRYEEGSPIYSWEYKADFIPPDERY